MALIDDLKAEKARLQKFKTDQIAILQGQVTLLTEHCDQQCALLDQQIAAEQARLAAAPQPAPAPASVTAKKK